MAKIRVYPDDKIQQALVEVATKFHEKLDKIIKEYPEKIAGLFPTERKIIEEIVC